MARSSVRSVGKSEALRAVVPQLKTTTSVGFRVLSAPFVSFTPI